MLHCLNTNIYYKLVSAHVARAKKIKNYLHFLSIEVNEEKQGTLLLSQRGITFDSAQLHSVIQYD